MGVVGLFLRKYIVGLVASACVGASVIVCHAFDFFPEQYLGYGLLRLIASPALVPWAAVFVAAIIAFIVAQGAIWADRLITGRRTTRKIADVSMARRVPRESIPEIPRAPTLKCSFSPHDNACVIPEVTITFAIRRGHTIAVNSGSGTSSSFTAISTDPSISHGTTLTPSTQFHYSSNDGPDERRIKGTYYRIKVEAGTATHVANCSGQIDWIEKDGVKIFADPIPLTFVRAEAPDTRAKTVRKEPPEYLDFLVLTDDSRILPASPNFESPSSFKPAQVFATPGDFKFHVSVVSPSPTAFIELTLRWTGDSTTSEVLWLDPLLPLKEAARVAYALLQGTIFADEIKEVARSPEKILELVMTQFLKRGEVWGKEWPSTEIRKVPTSVSLSISDDGNAAMYLGTTDPIFSGLCVSQASVDELVRYGKSMSQTF